MEKEQKGNYTSFEFWINILFQKGVLIVTELFGVLFLLRALTNPTFKLEIAIIGTILVFVGLAFEYLLWIKKTQFIDRRIESLETKSRRIDDDISKLVDKFIESAPKGSGADQN